MRSSRLHVAAGLAAVLGLVMVLGSPGTAVAAAILAPTSDARRVPVVPAALGALLGLVGFGVRQWWQRPGRGGR